MCLVTCGDLQDPTGLTHRAQGWSLLHLAASTAQPSSVAMLLKHGANVHGACYPGLAFICSNLKSLLDREGIHVFWLNCASYMQVVDCFWLFGRWHALWNGKHVAAC